MAIIGPLRSAGPDDGGRRPESLVAQLLIPSDVQTDSAGAELRDEIPDRAEGSGMIRVLSIFGTRPEAVKMAPVVRELGKHPDRVESFVCVTAQHRRMLDQVLDIFKIKPDFDLNLMEPNQTLCGLTARLLTALDPVLEELQPHWVLVQGDTTTSMAASLAAFYRGIKVGHVEAGLRTNNKRAPFPEEINRRITSTLCDHHFAPTQRARGALLAEGVPAELITVTGNTIVDALFLILKDLQANGSESDIVEYLSERISNIERFAGHARCPAPLPLQPSSGAESPRTSLATPPASSQAPQRLVLVTGHRRESFGDAFNQICLALSDIAAAHEDVRIVYPVHLNPNVQRPVHVILGGIDRIDLIEPLPYLPFVWLMEKAHIILTDSGGIQEEAPSLGKPVLVMRETTERPEGVEAGCSKLVGVARERIFEEADRLLTDQGEYRRMVKVENPYGDGRAAERIALHFAP
jgi:UDP-N-acetylglucosamine 2-epimerase (non-hydrolysing)